MKRSLCAASPLLTLAFAVGVGACAGPAAPTVRPVEAAFVAARAEGRLAQFLSAMPLGGELHHHFSGAPWAEELIELGAEAGLCLPPSSDWTPVAGPCDDDSVSLSLVARDPALREDLVRAWSMIDYQGGEADANAHFFSIFGRIAPAIEDIGAVLALVRRRAAREHISYIETMVQAPSATARLDGIVGTLSDDLGESRESVLRDATFIQARSLAIEALRSGQERSDALLGCRGVETARPAGCEVVVRFVYFILRVVPAEQFFARAVLAFEVAAASPLVVGVDIVGPEAGEVALRDYALHMRVLGALGQHYPGVGRALHAGELAPDDLPEGGNNHVSLAVAPPEEGGGGARRIGHGVSLFSEPNAQAVAADMAARRVPVAVNFTSNALLLGVASEDHPLPRLLAAGVPVTLSTDDPGIFRTTLAEQFVAAAGNETVNYGDLVRFARNSLAFSFLEGDGLWIDPGQYSEPRVACDAAMLMGQPEACSRLLERSPLARLQLRLEQGLREFEQSFAATER